MIHEVSKNKYLVEIPVGPQHPALHEPISLRLKVEGERVVQVDVVAGYNHRGIEWLAERKTFYQDLFLVTRTCGICNAVHGASYVQAVEDLAGIEVPPRARYLRTLVMELERIHSHILILAVMAEVIGFESLFMLMMRDRERVMYLKELVTGNRVHADYMFIGGVRRDLPSEKIDKIKKNIDYIEERMKEYKKIWSEDPIILKRTQEVGVASKSQALAHSLVGPVARGSNVKSDIRYIDPYDAYDEIPFNVITRDEGDSWARMMVRIDEVFESISIIKYILEHLPSGPIIPWKNIKLAPRKFPKGEGIGRVEAPRGELLYHVFSDGSMKPYRVKIRTPSILNIHNGVFMMLDQHIADIPVIFVSFDPCISCTERVTVIDLKTDEKKLIPWRKLVKEKPLR